MILFPMSLAVKWSQLPFATIGIALAMIFSFFFSNSVSENASYTFASQEFMNAHELLSYEMCMEKIKDARTCNQIYLINGSTDPESNTRREWLEKSLAAYDADPSTVSSYPSYKNFRENLEKNLAQFGKQKNPSSPNPNYISPTNIFTSMFRHENLLHLMINLALLLIFAAYVEIWLGSFTMIFTFLIGGFATTMLFIKYLSPNSMDVAGSNCALGLTVGLFTLLFRDARFYSLKLNWASRSRISISGTTKASLIALGISEVLFFLSMLNKNSAPIGLYIGGGFIGASLGVFFNSFLRPSYQSLFPISGTFFREVNWNRLTEIDLKVIQESLSKDPDFIDMRLKFFRSLDAILVRESRNKELNQRRLQMLEEMGKDWYCHFANQESQRKTVATFQRLSKAFPWPVLFLSTPQYQQRATQRLLTQAGIAYDEPIPQNTPKPA